MDIYLKGYFCFEIGERKIYAAIIPEFPEEDVLKLFV